MRKYVNKLFNGNHSGYFLLHETPPNNETLPRRFIRGYFFFFETWIQCQDKKLNFPIVQYQKSCFSLLCFKIWPTQIICKCMNKTSFVKNYFEECCLFALIGSTCFCSKQIIPSNTNSRLTWSMLPYKTYHFVKISIESIRKNRLAQFVYSCYFGHEFCIKVSMGILSFHYV